MAMAKTITLKETQATYSVSLEKTQLGDEPIIIEREGKKWAVLVPIAQFEQLQRLQKQATELERRAREEAFEREYAAFSRLKPQLLQTHRGLFVAVHNGQVVDSDADNLELARRIYANHLFPVCIELVSDEPRIVELPSPEEVWHVSL